MHSVNCYQPVWNFSDEHQASVERGHTQHASFDQWKAALKEKIRIRAELGVALEGPRVVACDLDGTLFACRREHPIRAWAVRAINLLVEHQDNRPKDQRIHFVMNTGRTLPAVLDGLAQYGGGTDFTSWPTVIAQTGTEIWHKINGEYEKDNDFIDSVLRPVRDSWNSSRLEQDFTSPAFKEKFQRESGIRSFGLHGHPFELKRVPIPNPLLAQLTTRAPNKEVERLVQILREEIKNICPNAGVNWSRDLAKGDEYVLEDGTTVEKGTAFIDIMPNGAGKLQALRYECIASRLTLADAIVLGDSGNDRHVLTNKETTGVIVQNAPTSFKGQIARVKFGADLFSHEAIRQAALSRAKSRRLDSFLFMPEGRSLGLADGIATAGVFEGLVRGGGNRIARDLLDCGALD